MFNIGGGEMIMIAIVAIILIPPQKLPEVATSVGKWIHDLQHGFNEVKNNMQSSLREDPPAPTAIEPPEKSIQVTKEVPSESGDESE